MFFLKLILVFLLTFALPVVIGYMLEHIAKCKFKNYISAWTFRYVMGMVALWAVFQVIAVPMILLKLKFSVLVISWIWVVSICIIAYLCYVRKKEATKPQYERIFGNSMSDNIFLVCAIVFLLVVVGYQCYKYLRFMHLDEDDSRFVVNAIDAYFNNTMMLTNPTTGEYMGTWIGDLAKDVASPWMMYVAMISKLSGIHPTIMAHTILPIILLIAAYGAYYLIGNLLFDADVKKSILFVGLIAFVNMYFSDTVYIQSFFSLVRIWQGKATLAAVMIPFMLYLMMRLYYHDDARNYFLIILGSIAMCLLSGMGIFFSAIMAGTYGIYFIFIKKQWKFIPYMIISCLPTLVYGIIYALIK